MTGFKVPTAACFIKSRSVSYRKRSCLQCVMV